MGTSQHDQAKSSSWSPGQSRSGGSQFDTRPFGEAEAAAAQSKGAASQFDSRPFGVVGGPGGATEIQAKQEASESGGFDLSGVSVFAGGNAPQPPAAPWGAAVPSLQREVDGEALGTEEERETEIQRNCDACAAENDGDEKPGGIQAKLTIGQPGDQYEQEADRVAAQVVEQIHSPQSQAVSNGVGASVQRQEVAEQAPVPNITLMRKGENGTAEAGADVEARIERSRGQGQPLGDGVRAPMEQAFGADFSGVRIHADGESDQLNRAVQAKAFTTGQDIYFRGGAYEPGSRGGQKLLAHELTHVVQQTGGVQAKSLKATLKSASTTSIQRDDEIEPIVVTGSVRSLPDQIAEDQQRANQIVDSSITWGSGNTTSYDEEGNAQQRQTALMENAQDAGVAEDLQRLSEEITGAKPVIKSWMLSQQSVTTIAESEGIDANSPPNQSVLNLLRDVGTTLNNTAEGSVGNRMMDRLREGSTATQVQAATGRLQGAMRSLQQAKRRLEIYKNQLERAARTRDIQQEEDKLTQIRATISTIATTITKIAQLTAAVTGAIGAASAALSGAQLNPAETFGSAAPGAVRSAPPGWVTSGSTRVAGSQSVIESVLEHTVFASRIEEVRGEITRLQGEVTQLDIRNATLDAENIISQLGEARDEYRGASQDLNHAQTSFFNAMRMAGRTYDQQDMTVEEAQRMPAAVPREGQEYSAEAVMSLIAALQGRRASRESFSTFLSETRYLRQADEIATDAMTSPRATFVPIEGGSRVLARPPIDYVDSESGFDPDPSTRLEVARLRQTIGNVMWAVNFYDEQHQLQQQIEEAWMSAMSSASGNLVH